MHRLFQGHCLEFRNSYINRILDPVAQITVNKSRIRIVNDTRFTSASRWPTRFSYSHGCMLAAPPFQNVKIIKNSVASRYLAGTKIAEGLPLQFQFFLRGTPKVLRESFYIRSVLYFLSASLFKVVRLFRLLFGVVEKLLLLKDWLTSAVVLLSRHLLWVSLLFINFSWFDRPNLAMRLLVGEYRGWPSLNSETPLRLRSTVEAFRFAVFWSWSPLLIFEV